MGVTDSGARALSEMKKAGKKIIGYYCCYVPVELLTAAHVLPYRILGDPEEQITEGDSVLETVMCPWVRNTFDQALKGKYSFLDGIIVPHVCDSVHRIFSFWKYYAKLPYSHFLDLPHVLSASSFKFFTQELAGLKTSLEDFTGHEISDEGLRNAINVHNENRELVQELYSLRRPDPPLVSAAEVLRLLKNGMRSPVEKFNETLREAINRAKGRSLSQLTIQPRLAVTGCIMDNDLLFTLVEGCGARVVMDDLPIGTRSFWYHVGPGTDPLAALSRTYLEKIRCPRTIVGKRTRPFKHEFEGRWGYLTAYGKEFGVNGFILNLLHYCDPHEYDFIDLRSYLQEKGFPALVLDDDYTFGSIQRVKTRVEAFVETLRTD